MAGYRFHEVTLAVHQDRPERGAELTRLLHDLLWVPTDVAARRPALCLAVYGRAPACPPPPTAREVFRADGFWGLEQGEDFYLTDGSSLMHLQAMRGQGEAWLSPTFGDQSLTRQRTFWAFGLLKLLRPLGFFGVHAAGVTPPHGEGLLIVGASGSGKSTLTLGLMRQGWGYLSDDAVLLRQQPEGVEALACRRYVYVDADEVRASAELPLGEEVPDSAGRRRRRAHVEHAYPGQGLFRCLPRLLLFSHIVPCRHSALRPLERLTALQHLLAQSGPQLFDRRTMGAQLDVLTSLLGQAHAYELRAGRDLYERPSTLIDLLAAVEGATPWRASSSS